MDRVIPLWAWSWILLAIAITGFLAVGSRKRWGWLICTATQPIWVIYALVTDQYGFIYAAILLTFTYSKNFLNWGKKESDLRKAPFFENVKGYFYKAELPLWRGDPFRHVLVMGDDFEIRYLNALAKAMGMPQTAVISRLQRGCKVAFLGGYEEIIGFLWISTASERVPVLGKTLALKDREAYLWNAWVDPRHRKNGIFTDMIIAAMNHLEHEASMVYAGSAADNPASIGAITNAGFQFATATNCIRVAGHSFRFNSKELEFK